MNLEEPFVAAVQAAATSSEADMMVARGVVLEAFAGAEAPAVTTVFEDRWVAAIGSHRPGDSTKFTAPAGHGVWSASRGSGSAGRAPDHISREACSASSPRSARRLGCRDARRRESVPASAREHPDRPSGRKLPHPGARALAAHRREPGSYSRFISVRSADRDGSEVPLPVEELLAGLDDILAARGATMVRESRRALQRELYLVSSSLLAAASEADAFNLARAVPSPPAAPTKKVEEGRDVAEVIRLRIQELQALEPRDR